MLAYSEQINKPVRLVNNVIKIEKSTGEIVDITEKVKSIEIKQFENNKSNQLTLNIVNKNGEFDILNPNTTNNDILDLNNKIIIEKGINGEMLPVGKYYITDAYRAKYQRGSAPTIQVVALDGMKELLQKVRTTKQYRNEKTTEIIRDILLTYTRLTNEDLDF
jgi:hypothetical protein